MRAPIGLPMTVTPQIECTPYLSLSLPEEPTVPSPSDDRLLRCPFEGARVPSSVSFFYLLA